MVKEINEKDFSEVITGDKVFVDCYATWCGPCKMLSPIVDSISEDFKDVEFYKLDVDEAQNIASEYGIMSIPTLLIFEKGELRNKAVGFKSREELEELLRF